MPPLHPPMCRVQRHRRSSDLRFRSECEFNGHFYSTPCRSQGKRRAEIYGKQSNTRPPFNINPKYRYQVSYGMKGIICYLPTRRPTSEEIRQRHSNPERCIELTPGFSEWNPHNPSYGTQENAMIDYHGDLILPRTTLSYVRQIGRASHVR